jgi:hypothetical protein
MKLYFIALLCFYMFADELDEILELEAPDEYAAAYSDIIPKATDFINPYTVSYTVFVSCASMGFLLVYQRIMKRYDLLKITDEEKTESYELAIEYFKQHQGDNSFIKD